MALPGPSNAPMELPSYPVAASSSITFESVRVDATPDAVRRDEERNAVERARAGDQQAFASLVDRYGRPVLSLCYASTLNHSDAEDLAQDVFLAAWRGLERFRGDSAFSTWLFSLTRNACVDRARRVATRPRPATENEQEEAASPSHRDEDRRTAREILEIAARLSPPLREALLLRDVQGLSYGEIAALQDAPIGTVRSRISSARGAVAEELRRG